MPGTAFSIALIYKLNSTTYPQIQNWQSKVYLKLTFDRTFAFYGWTIKDVDLSRKIKSNLFSRRSFCRIVELSSPSGSKSIENRKSDLLNQGKTSQFDEIVKKSANSAKKQKNKTTLLLQFYNVLLIPLFW